MAVSLGITITQNSQSIVNCSSNITVSVYCWWSAGSYNKNYPAPAGWLNIDGVQYDFRNTFNDDRTTSGSKTLFSKTLDISHNSEGVKTVYCSAYFATGVSSGNISASKSLRLNDIPRYARIEQAADFTDEENPTITYANYAGDLADVLQAAISIDGENPLIAYRAIEKGAESYTFHLTNAERNVLRLATPASNDLAVTFLMQTTIGEDVGITTFPATMHIVNADPVVAPVIVDTNSVTVAVTGDASVLVARHSIANVTINAAAQKGAAIASQRVEQGGLVLNGDCEFLVSSADPIIITVTDSRGNVTVLQAPNVLIPYLDASCSIEHTMPEGDGEMPLTVVGKAYNGTIGSTENVITVQYRYKSGYGEYGEWVTIDTVTHTGSDFEADTIVTGLDYKVRHTFQARVIDAIATEGILSTEKVFIAVPVFDWGPEDFRFNVPVIAEKVTGLAAPVDDTDAANKEYVDTEVKAAKDAVNTKIGLTLLWENANPDIYFYAQTVALDLTEYDAVLIRGHRGESLFALIGETNLLMLSFNGYYICSRTVDVGMDGVTFNQFYKYTSYGTGNSTTENAGSMLTPHYIYGIKGVTRVENDDTDAVAICGEFLCGELNCG